MSDHDCPLWPEVQRLQQKAARLDARVHALEAHGLQTHGPQHDASGPAGHFSLYLRRVLSGRRRDHLGRMPQEGAPLRVCMTCGKPTHTGPCQDLP